MFVIVCLLLINSIHGLQLQTNSRRRFLSNSLGTLTIGSTISTKPQIADAVTSGNAPALNFETSKSGIQWADAKIGTGPILEKGSMASIDYALSTTGARYGSSIYKSSSSNNAGVGAPYRWTLGDGSTITGLEEAILGGEGIVPMRPGGVRRMIIPPSLGYSKLMDLAENCGQKGTYGPVPPPQEAFEEFQRFKNIYCNPNRAYQPDIVLDVKLYGKRS